MFGIRGYPTIWFVRPEIKNQTSVNYTQLGSTGYVAGGPNKWIEAAEKILINK